MKPDDQSRAAIALVETAKAAHRSRMRLVLNVLQNLPINVPGFEKPATTGGNCTPGKGCETRSLYPGGDALGNAGRESEQW